MSRWIACLIAACSLVSVGLVSTGRSAPAVALEDGGRTIVYRGQPGDTPSAVAGAMGVPDADVERWLRSNGITDATRVPRDFRYRFPNPLATQADTQTARAAEAERTATAATGRAAALERELTQLRDTATLTEAEVARLAMLERRWRWLLAGLVLTSLGLVGAALVAAAALRKERAAARWARTLSHELDSRQHAGMAERQYAAKQIVDLEQRVRQLEQQLASRVRMIGRGG